MKPHNQKNSSETNIQILGFAAVFICKSIMARNIVQNI